MTIFIVRHDHGGEMHDIGVALGEQALRILVDEHDDGHLYVTGYDLDGNGASTEPYIYPRAS